MVDELTVKSFESPDETITFDNGQSKSVQLGEKTFWLTTVEPGWKFSKDNAPELGTTNCPDSHRLHMLSGQMTVEMADGTCETLQQGDVALIPPDHDGWTEGDKQAVFFEEDS